MQAAVNVFAGKITIRAQDIRLDFLEIIFLCNSKLLFVNVHFRHGARGSLFLDRKKGYDLLGMKWKKRGMLTPKGKRQVF